jgi:hypothetical protein
MVIIIYKNMKYIKLFEGYKSESEVREICKKYGIKNWSINSDGLVDVNGNVDLSFEKLTELPLQFGKVTGSFDCSDNRLTTLKGSPNTVDSWFDCRDNKLTSLEFCPRSVGTNFYCGWNKIREFTGLKYIGGYFYCSALVHQHYRFTGNPIQNIWDIISPDQKWDEEKMEFFEDCSIIHDNGESVAIDRLNFFLEEIGLKPVEKVDGYINI